MLCIARNYIDQTDARDSRRTPIYARYSRRGSFRNTRGSKISADISNLPKRWSFFRTNFSGRRDHVKHSRSFWRLLGRAGTTVLLWQNRKLPIVFVRLFWGRMRPERAGWSIKFTWGCAVNMAPNCWLGTPQWSSRGWTKPLGQLTHTTDRPLAKRDIVGAIWPSCRLFD